MSGMHVHPAEESKSLKKRKAKELSFCQRLVEQLDPPLAKKKRKRRKRTPRPPILKLPTEIRQQILHNTLEDDDILHSDLNEQAAPLRAVCRTFHRELPWVLEQWAARHEELNAAHRNTFTSLIDDLMSAAGIDRPPLRAPRRWQSHGKRVRDFAPRSHGVGVHAPTVLQDDGVEGAGAGTEPFAAMEKWKTQRMEDMRQDQRTRDSGAYLRSNGLRRRTALEKKNMKFKNLSFLTPGQDQVPDFRGVNGAGTETGTIVDEGSTKEKWRQRRKYDERRRVLEKEERKALKKEGKRQARWVEECLVNGGSANGSRIGSGAECIASAGNASALVGNPASHTGGDDAVVPSKEERRARSKARKRAKRRQRNERKNEYRRQASILQEEERQEEWRARDPEAARRSEAVMMLKGAYNCNSHRPWIGRTESGVEGGTVLT